MKTDRIKIRIYTALLLGLFIFSVIRASDSKESNQKTTSTPSVKSSYEKVDLLKDYRYYSNLGEDISVKFFDQNDELVYEGEIKAGERIRDRKVLLLLLDSEFLTNSSFISQYKTFKN